MFHSRAEYLSVGTLSGMWMVATSACGETAHIMYTALTTEYRKPRRWYRSHIFFCPSDLLNQYCSTKVPPRAEVTCLFHSLKFSHAPKIQIQAIQPKPSNICYVTASSCPALWSCRITKSLTPLFLVFVRTFPTSCTCQSINTFEGCRIYFSRNFWSVISRGINWLEETECWLERVCGMDRHASAIPCATTSGSSVCPWNQTDSERLNGTWKCRFQFPPSSGIFGQ